MKSKAPRKLTYAEQHVKCKEFISEYNDFNEDEQPHPTHGRKKYMIKLVINLLKLSKPSRMKSRKT